MFEGFNLPQYNSLFAGSHNNKLLRLIIIEGFIVDVQSWLNHWFGSLLQVNGDKLPRPHDCYTKLSSYATSL